MATLANWGLFLGLLIGLMGVSCLDRANQMKRKVCIYTGSGASLAKDVERALDKLNISYRKIAEKEIKKGDLKDHSVLIIPGGYTKRCVDALGEEGFRHIREFIRDGGGYVGICAGAYLASGIVEVEGHPKGLGIINIRNIRKQGVGIRNIFITQPNHTITSGYKGEIRIWYQNGPMMKAEENTEVLANYGEGYAAIVWAKFGSGKVVIFSPHPEGNLEKRINPKSLRTLKLLKNTMLFVERGEKENETLEQ